MLQKIPCKAVIFDFDGTLADSMPFLERIGVQVMMKYYDVDLVEATERYRSTTGLPYEHQIAVNFPNDERNAAAVEEFEHLKIERIFEQELFEDTRSTLTRINEMGIRIFVSSSTFQPTIERYFQEREMAGLFAAILGYRPGFEKGEHHFRYVENNHDIALNDMVFVGDSLKDYERSKGFCRFIGIERLFSEEEFREAGHTGFVVRRLSEVPDLLEPMS